MNQNPHIPTAFTNGRILTMDPGQEDAEVIIIQDEHIVAVGDKKILVDYPDARIIDLGGRTLLPAFIDSHNHLSSFACFFPTWANLFGLMTKDVILDALKTHAGKYPGSSWIAGFGWFDAKGGGVDLTRYDLDELGSDRPVLVIHATFHMSVASSRALEMAGISGSTPGPRCGIIVKDAGGIPNGVLIEHAQAPFFRATMEPGIREHADLIRARAEELLPLGITAIHDPGVTPAAARAYRLLQSEGNLPVSVLMMPHGSTVLDNQPGCWLDEPATGCGDETLRIGPVKVFADGATPETVAFSMKMMGRTITSGNYRDDFRDVLLEAVRRGFQVCVHSFGNVTTDAVLDAFEQAGGEAPAGFAMRPRLEHVSLLSKTQIKRLAAMGGCACIQPQFLIRATARANLFARAPVENAKWFPCADLIRAGVCVAASSDDPGGSMDPRDPIRGSVMGSTMSSGDGNTVFPDQVLPFETWLWMYTAGSARAGGQENERGMLKKRLVADLVILEGALDPKTPPVVDETWRNGTRVYCRQAAGEPTSAAGPVPNGRIVSRRLCEGD